MVSVLKWFGGKSFSRHLCAGSIISSRYILTSAGCVEYFQTSEVAIYVGAYETVAKNSKLDPNNVYFVEEIKIHPDWNTNTIRNDVALIKLNRHISYTNTISPICLPPPSDSAAVLGKKLVLTGWGDDETKQQPEVLQQAALTIINDPTLCTYYDISSNYCAIGNTTSIGANGCYGDSGGPLQYYKGSKWYAYGIASYLFVYENGNCANDYPSFYTNVPYFVNWITSNAI